MGKAHLGLIGLAVMGRNLVLNLSDHGHQVAVYNRTWARTQEFLAGEGVGRDILGCASLPELVGALRSPRLVMLMVRAGPGVDAVIDQLVPLLAPGDVIIDGGNSHYPDTARRYARLAAVGLRFLGMGVSGGEEGARHGPSLMPGGDPEAWPLVRDIFQSIAAVAEGEPCCQWVGEGGAGHYVKMVHNGIEYGDMQLIAEAYQLLRQGLGLSTDQVATVFARWNQGLLESYLIEITAAILAVRDPDGVPRVDRILDSAGQKGTGQWTALDALEQGIPLTLIGEAVNARFLSALTDVRARAAQAFPAAPQAGDLDPSQPWVEFVHDALYAAKLVSYAQGFMLLRAASNRFGWRLAYGDIALLWRGGCIIRSRFLGDIKRAFDQAPDLENLLVRRLLRRRHPPGRGRLAPGGDPGCPTWHPLAGFRRRPELLRWLPQRPPAGQSPPGPTGLFRCPHLCPPGCPRRRALSYRLDGRSSGASGR
jgi:6-phosphogluconate dehydrogenase